MNELAGDRVPVSRNIEATNYLGVNGYVVVYQTLPSGADFGHVILHRDTARDLVALLQKWLDEEAIRKVVGGSDGK